MSLVPRQDGARYPLSLAKCLTLARRGRSVYGLSKGKAANLEIGGFAIKQEAGGD
jgi:hypothetical protein